MGPRATQGPGPLRAQIKAYLKYMSYNQLILRKVRHVTLLKEGGRFNGRGNRLQMYEVGHEVEWQEADDYEMFLEMVFDKLS